MLVMLPLKLQMHLQLIVSENVISVFELSL